MKVRYEVAFCFLSFLSIPLFTFFFCRLPRFDTIGRGCGCRGGFDRRVTISAFDTKLLNHQLTRAFNWQRDVFLYSWKSKEIIKGSTFNSSRVQPGPYFRLEQNVTEDVERTPE